MAKKPDTGECEPYSDADLTVLGMFIMDTVDRTGSAPASIRAKVEYHGVTARANNGVRKFTLDQLTPAQKAKVVEAARKASEARRLAREAQPKKSYRSRDWRAQFSQLFRTQKGYEAMDRAGVTATKGTLGRWLRGTQEPSKANREAIARAYEGMRMEPVRNATQRSEEQARDVAQVFDKVVSEAYGDNGVRFRNIDPSQ